MREIEERKERKTVITNMKSSADNTLVPFNLRIKQWEKTEIENMVKDINNEQRPDVKVTQVLLIRKALKLLKRELTRKDWDKIV